MENDYKTVIQGEAEESSSDEEPYQEMPTSVVVEGEASESDEEEIDTSSNARKNDLPSLRLEHSTSFDSFEEINHSPHMLYKQMGKPKYDTVLNKKLWESNLSLCNNLNGMVSQAYLSAAKEITNCSSQLSKSHASIQDVSHHMRILTNDLFNLDDRIDIVTTCKLLPDIKLPSPPAAVGASSASQH